MSVLGVQHSPRRGRALLIVLGVAWLAAGVGGLALLGAYKATPGPETSAPSSWPAGSVVTRDAGRPTVVLLAHPQCPCTRATLSELSRVLANEGAGAAVRVVFTVEGGVDGLPRAKLWEQAHALKNAIVVEDHDGSEGARFGSVTSGTVLVYDAAGTLRFEGGVTGSRGHEGENAGADRLAAVLKNGAASASSTSPVFGCALSSRTARME